MSTLSETPEWVDVYQIETTDPVVGGAPNEGTGAGMTNIPHLHLAKRTAFLKDLVESAGLGAGVGPEVSNFNQVAKSGLYWGSNATGAPSTDTHVLLHLQGSAADESVQIAARIPTDKVFLRRRTAGTWQNWTEIAHAGNLSDLLGGLPDNVVLKAGAQTITGVKTFDASPVVPVPTAAGHAARKAYVDDAASGRVPNSRQVVAGSGLSGGGALDADRTLSLAVATAAELLAGSANDRAVSPKSIKDGLAFQTVSDGAIALDLAAGMNFRTTLTMNSELGNPTGGYSGQTGEIKVTQDGTGSRALTFGSAWEIYGSRGAVAQAPGSKSVISYKVVSPTEVIASISVEAV